MITALRCTASCDDNDIPATDQILFLMAADLTDSALKTVTFHTVPELFTGGNPESVTGQSIFGGIDHKIPVRDRPAVMINPLKIPVLLQRQHIQPKNVLKQTDRNAIAARSLSTLSHEIQADNLFLPLALLAASTFLPPVVLILDRNPCTLFLCSRCG